ncbi:MAG: glutamate dehydrogenase, partial [Pseudomonadota bacterium]
NQIDIPEAGLMQVRLVAEGANGPVTPQGESVLADKGVELIPDILANAGGVVVSYFEWIQNKSFSYWEAEEIESRLRRKLTSTYESVLAIAEASEVDMRTACYCKALKHLETVYTQRGLSTR